jgi:hypothetical protein
MTNKESTTGDTMEKVSLEAVEAVLEYLRASYDVAMISRGFDEAEVKAVNDIVDSHLTLALKLVGR